MRQLPMISLLVFGFLFALPVKGQAISPDLFKIKDKAFKESDLPPTIRHQIYETEMERYERLTKLAEGAAIDAWIAEEAKRTGKSVTAVAADKLKVDAPTDKQLKDFYDKNKERIPAPFDQVKAQIAQVITEQAKEEKKAKLITELKTKKIFTLVLPEPVSPQFAVNTTGFAAYGTESPKATVVIFTDFKCPHCKHFNDAFKPITKKYRSRVRFVFPDFPLRVGGPSELIAIGAQCADEQKKFLEYHDLAFDRQQELKDDAALALAKELKLDEKKFQTCMTGTTAREAVNRGRLEGDRLGVGGTPTIFINGRRVMLRPDTAAISAEIDKFLK